jgi:hypothetical protein
MFSSSKRAIFSAAKDYAGIGWPVFQSNSQELTCFVCVISHTTPKSRFSCTCLYCHGVYSATTNLAKIQTMVKEVSEPIPCIVTGEISGPVVVEFAATDGIRTAVHLTQAGMLRTEQSYRSPSSRPRTRPARPIRSTPAPREHLELLLNRDRRLIGWLISVNVAPGQCPLPTRHNEGRAAVRLHAPGSSGLDGAATPCEGHPGRRSTRLPHRLAPRRRGRVSHRMAYLRASGDAERCFSWACIT